MHPGLLDVFHDAADDDVFAVGQGVHVHLGSFLEELIDQHRPRWTHQCGSRDVVLHGLQIVGDDHGTPTKHVTGAHQNRQSDFFGHASGFFGDQCRPIARLRNPQFVEQASETAAVFGQVDRLRWGADNGDIIIFELERQI